MVATVAGLAVLACLGKGSQIGEKALGCIEGKSERRCCMLSGVWMMMIRNAWRRGK